MNYREQLKSFGDFGGYAALDTSICKWADNRITELEQQLANYQKQNVLLRETLDYAANTLANEGLWESVTLCEKALAATADLAGLVVCDAVPAGTLAHSWDV
jgi:hypothetical protein